MSQWDDFLYLSAAPRPEDGGLRALTSGPGEGERLVPGEDYVRFNILSQRLHTRGFMQTLYPAVHFRAFARGDLDFQTFVAPEFLGSVSKARLDRVLQREQSVLGPVPFRGDLQLEFGLFAAEARDELGQMLSMLSEISAHAHVPFVSAALPFATLLKSGVDKAFGTEEGFKLEVGYRGSLRTRSQAGVFAVVFNRKAGLSDTDLYLNSNDILVNAQGKPVRKAPYIVFEIERLQWRHDWMFAPDLQEPWAIIREAGVTGDLETFEAAIGRFRRACETSLDLCRPQAKLLQEFADEVAQSAADSYARYESVGDETRSSFDPGRLEDAFDQVFLAGDAAAEDEADIGAPAFESLGLVEPALRGVAARGAIQLGNRIFRKKKDVADEVPEPPREAGEPEDEEAADTGGLPPAFERALDFVLRWEGGFVNDPDDPGGATNMGVTQATYDRWRDKMGRHWADVRQITHEEVRQIYFEDYWTPVVRPRWPGRIATVLFDTAINMGPRRGIKILQEAINTALGEARLVCDGISGRQTEQAMRECLSQGPGFVDRLLDAYLDVRRGVYHAIVERRPSSRKFLRGWLNRVRDLENHVKGGPRFESTGEAITAEPTRRIPDLGPGEPLEAPVPADKRGRSAGPVYEAVAALTKEEIAARTEALQAEASDSERYGAALDLMVDLMNADMDGRAEAIAGLLKALRNAREFDLLHAMALVAEDMREVRATARRYKAQALIELGLYDEALRTLDRILDEDRDNDFEVLEARGLRGRVFKDLYLDPEGDLADKPVFLDKAVTAYLEPFREVPAHRQGERIWHGVNALAMLTRADRDGLTVRPKEDRTALARRVIEVADENIARAGNPADAAWDMASAAEAHLALEEWQAAEERLAAYIEASKEPFQLAGTLRQLKQVWQLERADAPPEAQELVTALKIALMGLPGAGVELSEAEYETIRASDVEDMRRKHPVLRAESPVFEAVIGGVEVTEFEWVKRLVELGAAIARIDSDKGNPKGTGFLVDGGALWEGWAGLPVVLTNEHVVSPRPRKGELTWMGSRVTFTKAPGRDRLRVAALLWSSPREMHDVSVLKLERMPEGVTPLTLPPLTAAHWPDTKEVTVIGHPSGRELSLAIRNLALADHNAPGEDTAPDPVLLRYKASTEGGNSGSPVFDWESLDLIGIHHAYFDRCERLRPESVDETPTTYERTSSRFRKRRPKAGLERPGTPSNLLLDANEGIWLPSIQRAIRDSGGEAPA